MFKIRDKTCLKIRKNLVSISSMGRKKTVKRMQNPEAVIQRCSIKKAFLKILQNSQENTCAGVSL